MKLACSSTAFDALLRSGELTQLEWLDLCAHELAADGIVFDMRHFPRTDADYLAQLKKMAVDLGLCAAALRHDAFFGAEPAGMDETFQTALALGTPLLSAPLPQETDASWEAVQARLSVASALAKRHNVTIAIRNAPRSFASSTHDMKRITKEADSAWIRYGPQFDAFDAASEPAVLLPKTVFAWARYETDPSRLRALLGSYGGFLALDSESAEGNIQSAKSAFAACRAAMAFRVP